MLHLKAIAELYTGAFKVKFVEICFKYKYLKCTLFLCVVFCSLVLNISAGSVSWAANVDKGIELFGKMEIKSSTNSVPMWLDVLKRNEDNYLFSDGTKMKNPAWLDLKAKWEGLPFKEKLKAVNLFWNKRPYRQDVEVYGKPDYWAAPVEFYKKSGDCEDYAIAKYFTLVELGIPKEDMRIAIVKETIRNIAHAILIVYGDGDAFVLDNLSNQVLGHKIYKHYDIQFSINEFYKWGHFKAKKKE